MKMLVLLTICLNALAAQADESLSRMQAATDRVADCQSRRANCSAEEKEWLAQVAAVREEALAAEAAPASKVHKKPVHRPRPVGVSEEARRRLDCIMLEMEARRAGIPFFPTWCR